MQKKENTQQDQPTFKLGDQVSYCVTTSTSNGYRISAREGKVVAVDGQVAVVQSRNGRRCMQPFSKLTPKGQRNALTRALLGE